MKTSSGKAKGRKLQQWVANTMRSVLNVPAHMVRSTSMGAQGADVQLSGVARELMPFAIECKNMERLNLWKAWEQAEHHASVETDLRPLLVVKKNHTAPLVVLDAAYFFNNWRKNDTND